MASFTKLYELSIVSSDPTGETSDVGFVSIFEVVGNTKRLVAQSQCNPNTAGISPLATFAAEAASGLVIHAFSQ